MTKLIIELPKYAWEYHHPANQPGDVSATFYEDGNFGGSITVSIQRGESERGDPPNYFLSTERSGLSESRFTCRELARIIEVAGCLAKHLAVS